MLLSNYNVKLWGVADVSHKVGSCQYTEYAVTDSLQEMGLHLGDEPGG